MDMIFPLLGLAIPILIIVGIVYFILRIRAGTSIQFSYRGALRTYFYIVILVSVGLAGLGGAATLLKVGFGEIAGREFSYGNVYEEHRFLAYEEHGTHYLTIRMRLEKQKMTTESRHGILQKKNRRCTPRWYDGIIGRLPIY